MSRLCTTKLRLCKLCKPGSEFEDKPAITPGMLPNFPDSEMENSLLDPEDHEDKAQKYPVRGTDDIRDEDLLSNSAFNSLEGNSRHATSWRMLEDEVIPAEPDQEVMDWLQNQV